MNLQQKSLKLFYPLLIRLGKWSKKNRKVLINLEKNSKGFYDLSFEKNKGAIISTSSLLGKKILIVNTASGCGYTSQYEKLEELATTYPNTEVVCFPANDFKQQEKASDDNIASFCKLNYGNRFTLAKKTVVVKKEGQHPIYEWLCDPAKNGWNDRAPSWNFCKYLIDEVGNLVGFFEAGIEPDEKSITDHLQK